jgi:NarL family two-component system response regulator LiaR
LNKIRVLLVDDNINWTKEMMKFLDKEEDIRVVAYAVNSEEALNSIKDNEIDVILMDINLTGNKYDGIYLTAEITQFSKAKIIMLTSLSNEDIIVDSFKAGAVNFISKEEYLSIPNIIRSTYKTITPLEVLLKDYSRLKTEEQLRSLSPAENEIFGLLEKGCTQIEIQKNLFKSESTIKNQIGQILKKLCVKSSKEAIKKVRMKGIDESGRRQE